MTYEAKKNAAFFYKDWKRMLRMFRSFIKNGKEHKKLSILLKRMEKNAKNVPFFYKEQKRTQKTFRSFIKNRKVRKKRSVLYKRNDAQTTCYETICTECRRAVFKTSRATGSLSHMLAYICRSLESHA